MQYIEHKEIEYSFVRTINLNVNKIGIVILSYNNYIDTRDCIQSIIECKTNCDLKICVIDNSPNDVAFNHLVCDFPSITMIKIDENKGYAHGNNIGLNHFRSVGINYFMVINNDTIVTDYFVDKLVEKQKEFGGIVSPLIIHYEDKITIWSAGGYYSKLFSNYKMYRKHNTDHKIEFLSGCCILFDVEIFDILGDLPEDYFMYGEDSEYSFKAKKNGINLSVVGDSVIYHKVGISSIKESPFQFYYLMKSRFIFINRNFTGKEKNFSTFSTIIQGIFYVMKFLLKNRRVSKAIIYAIIDRNKRGRVRY